MKTKSFLPDDFSLTDDMRQWAKTNTPGVNIEKQLEMFCDYWRAHGKRMCDWTATWRNWMRRAPEFERPVNRYSNFSRAPQVSAPPTPDQEDAYRRRMEAASRAAADRFAVPAQTFRKVQ